MPLCESSTTAHAPLPRASSTTFCRRSSEYRIVEVGGAHVLREELYAALELFRDRFFDTLRAVSELPVPGHRVDAEQFGRRDHVFAASPQRGSRALPAVAAVEEEGARALRSHRLHQRREVGEAAEPAVALRGLGEIEAGIGVSVRRGARHSEVLEESFADEVRRPSVRIGDADVHIGLAEMHRQELRVAVGEMEKRDLAARRRQAVERIGGVGRAAREPDGQPRGGGGGEGFEEVPAVHVS
jgi:hypothetical protein